MLDPRASGALAPARQVQWLATKARGAATPRRFARRFGLGQGHCPQRRCANIFRASAAPPREDWGTARAASEGQGLRRMAAPPKSPPAAPG